MKSSHRVGSIFFFIMMPLLFWGSAAYAQLQGGSTYPINGTENPPTSFASITSAVAYMTTNGVTGTGQVILELSAGYAGESAPLTIPAITGTSATLGITFRPASGYTALTTIAGTSANPYAIKITGSYITLDGQGGGGGGGRDWTIRCTGSGTAGYGQSAVRIENTASAATTDVTVKNCILEGETASTTSGIVATGGSASFTLKNVLITNNLIRSTGVTGTNCRGYAVNISSPSNAGNTGLVISNNQINDFYARGIYFAATFPQAVFFGNNIYHTAAVTQPSTTEFSAIYYSTTTSPGTSIYNNFIHDIQLTNGTTACNGIYVFNGNTSGLANRIYNNRVNIGAGIQPTTVPIYGIRDNSVSLALFQVDYNSVYIGGSPAAGAINSACYRKEVNSSTSLRNNIFFNARSNSGTATGIHWAISINAQTNLVAINNNDYFANGVGGVLGTTTGSSGGNQTTLAGWKAAVPADNASVSQDPHYVNATATPPDMHLDTAIATQLESGGQIVSGIDNDFEGDIRYGSAGYGGTGTAPDIGSDEFNGIYADLTPPTITYSLIGNSTSLTTLAFPNVTITDASGVNGTLGTRPRVYYKKSTNANAWNDNTSATDGWKYAEANGSTSPFDFTIDYSRIFGGTVGAGDVIQYFVVAQDLASTPNVGINSGTFAAPPASVDLTAAAFPIGGTINSYTIVGFISGTKTVGTGGDYATLKAAFDAVNGSVVNGDLTLTILASGTTETASAILNAVTYQGGPWTITVKPDIGAAPTITGSITGAVIKLNGADHVVINGTNSALLTTRDLTISNTSATAATAAIWLSSLGAGAGCTNNTIENCVLLCGVDQSASTSETFGVIASGTAISTTSNGADNDSDTFANLDIRKARWGIYAIGAAAPNLNDNMTITQCVIGPAAFGSEQIGKGGIILKYANLATISRNEVRCVGILYTQTSTSGSDRTGIGLGADGWTPAGTPVTNSMVTRNLVHDIVEERTFSALGITLSGQGSPSGNLVANNMIYNVRANGTGGDEAVGLGIGDGNGDKVVFNTVSMTGDLDPGSTTSCSTSGAGIRIYSTPSANLTLKDNITSVDLNSNTGSLHHYSIIAPSTSYAWGTGGSDNNDLYPKSGNAQCVLGGLGGSGTFTDVSTLGAWRTTFTPNQDGNSQSVEPAFVSATDLHLRTDVPTTLESAGTPIAGVTDDYDGDVRNVTTPDIGADEGNFLLPNANDVAAIAFVNPTNGATKIVNVAFGPQASFQNVGSAPQTNVPVRFRIIDPSAVEVYNQLVTIPSMPINDPPVIVTFPDFTPTSGGTYTMHAKAELAGDFNPANDEIIGAFSVLAPLAGVYNVGAAQPAPFNTLTGAIGALNTVGIAGNVIFSLVDAVYTTPAETFPIVVNAYPGENPSYAVTIKPASAGVSITGASTTGVIVLNGADYVVIDGSSTVLTPRDLTITNTSTSGGTACVWLESQGAGAGAMNNAIKNCVLIGGADQTTSTSDTFGILASGTAVSPSSQGADNDNNVISNVEVRKVRWGIYLIGLSGNLNDSNSITDCLVGPAAFGADQISKGGIVIQYQNLATVSRNEVRSVGVLVSQSASGTDRIGIGIGGNGWTPTSTAVTNSTIARNVVHDVVEEKTYSAVGIVVAGSGSPSGNVIANNMIYGIRANGTAGDQCVGIGISDGNGDKIVYNSISLSGDLDPAGTTASTVSAAGIRISIATPANLTLKDNITSVDFTSNTSSLKHYTIVAPSTSYAWGTGGCDNNDYYPNPANAQMVLGGIGTSVPYTEVATLGAWRTQFTPNQDSASLNANPPFISATDLHLIPGSQTALESGGTPIAGVIDDYDGDVRNATTPDIGADEFNGVAVDQTPPSISYSLLGNSTSTTTVAFTNVTVTDASGVDGALGTRPRVYYKKATNANAWNDNTSLTDGWKYAEAHGSTSPFDFTIDYSILFGGTVTPGDQIQYFVVAQDLAAPPNVGINSGTFASPPASVALTASAFPIGGTINSYLVVGLFSGVHTVGSVGGEYASLKAAFDAINAGIVNGDVALKVLASGTTEPAAAVLNAVTYQGGPWTITVKPDTAATPIITGSVAGALVKLVGADHVVINGSNAIGLTASRDLTIENTNQSTSAAVIWVQTGAGNDGATYDTIENCNVVGAGNTYTLIGIGFGGSTVGTTSNGVGNSNNTIRNNNVSKTQYGIYTAGSPGAGKNVGNVVTENAVNTVAPNNVTFGGILARFENGIQITKNSVGEINRASGSNFGISLGFQTSMNLGTAAGDTCYNVVVTGNKVASIVSPSSTGWTAAGISIAPSTSGTNLIANNMVSGVTSQATPTDFTVGIYALCGTGSTTNIYFNSVYMSGERGSASQPSFALAVGGSDPIADVRDNILVNTQTTTGAGKSYAIGLGYASFTNLVSNYNDLYVTGALGNVGITGGFTNTPAGDHLTLADWQTATGKDTASLSADPLFVSTTDVHINTSGVPVSPVANAGTTIAGITTDFDGETRLSPPDIGADEFATYTLTVHVVGGGSVTKSPDQPLYNAGTHVTLTAVADPTYIFYEWTGDATGSQNPLDVLMNANKDITAHFVPNSEAVLLNLVPGSTFLAPSYPNPLQESATIFWGLHETGPTRLQIFDVQGRLVRDIENSTVTKGYKKNVWDGRDNGGRRVAAGFYVLRLQSDHKVIKQRMVVIR